MVPDMTTAPIRQLRSMRDHPEWAPVVGTLTVGGWHVDTWEEPVLPGAVSFDDTLVRALGDRLRLAVVDGAHNLNSPNGYDQVTKAIRTVRGHLATTIDARAALDAAAAELHDPSEPMRQRNPLATVAVVDLDRSTGRGQAIRCGDSEVWIRQDGTWVSLFEGDMLTDTARRAYDREVERLRHSGLTDWWAVQEVLFDDPATWRCPAVGPEPVTRPDVAAFEDVDEVIVSTDGAKLTPERCASLAEWLSGGLQHLSADTIYSSAHGDVAVLHAKPSHRPS